MSKHEEMLKEFKDVYDSLQQQISELCLNKVIDSNAIRNLRKKRTDVKIIIANLSNKLTSDIIA